MKLAPLLLLAAASAATAAEPRPLYVFELDPRVELLSAAILAVDPAAAAPLARDEYARAARAALGGGSAGPALRTLSALLKRGVPAQRLARAVLDPAAAEDDETRAALAEVEELGRRRGFDAFLAARRQAREAIVLAAQEEELDAISPEAAARYVGRPFETGQRFVLAPLLAAAPDGTAESWRDEGGRWVHVRPRRARPDGRLGFGLDSFEGSAAHALLLTALSGLEPATARMREQLAFAVQARVVARDIGEESELRLIQRPSLGGFARLRETAAALRDYEARRAAGGLDAFLPGFLPLARMRLDEAAPAARSGRKADARALAAAALAAPLGPDDLRRAAAILADLGEFAQARAALERVGKAAGASDAKLALEAARQAARSGARAEALALVDRARRLPGALPLELADAYLELGRTSRALELLEEAERSKPGPELSRRIAWARSRLKQGAAAAEPSPPSYSRACGPARPGESYAPGKSSGTFRVFVIGSTARLLSDQGAGGDLVDALREGLPSRSIETVICGADDFDGARDGLVLNEALERSPDLIVLLPGRNEGRDDLSSPRGSDAWERSRSARFAENLAANIRSARARGVPVALVVPPLNYRAPVETSLTTYDRELVRGWVRFLRSDFEGARRAWRESLGSKSSSEADAAERRAFTLGLAARAEERLGLAAEARASFEAAARADRGQARCTPPCQDAIRRAADRHRAILVDVDAAMRAAAAPGMPGMERFTGRSHWRSAATCSISADIVDAVRRSARSVPWDAAGLERFRARCGKPDSQAAETDDLRTLGEVVVTLTLQRDSWKPSPVLAFYLQYLRSRHPRWFDDVGATAARAAAPRIIGDAATDPIPAILPRLQWLVGEALLLDHDYAGAADRFRAALKLEPKLLGARLSLALAEGLGGRRGRAIAALEALPASAAQDPVRDELLSSAEALADALGLDAAKIAALRCETWLKRAELALASGRRADAEAALRRAEGLGPDEEQRRRIGQFSARALSLPAERTPAAADGAETWVAKAEAAAKAGDKPAGMEALERAMTLSPEPHQLRRIAQHYRLFKETKRFLGMSGALAAAYPNDAEIWLMLAEALLMTGKREEGVKALETAERLRPPTALREWLKTMQRWAKEGAPSDAEPPESKGGKR